MITFNKDQVESTRVNMRGGAGDVQLTALVSELPEKMRLFSQITLKPGCGIGYHTHENETELFYFISGSGRVQDDDQFIDVKAGDAMSTPNGHGHAVENTGDCNLVFVAAIVKD